MEETPPTFCFVKEEGEKTYTVLVRKKEGELIFQETTKKNYVIPGEIFLPGDYQWNLICDGKERGWWEFSISDRAVPFLRPTAKEVFASVPDVRPRHLFYREDLEEIRRDRKEELETLRRNIALALTRPLPEPPLFHRDKNALPYREYFGRYRDFCDRDMVACALGYVILEDKKAGEKAKELFLTICDFNPLGPCSLIYPWNDEIGLSNARCLPIVYDLIRDLLTEQQIYLAEKTIEAYALQCEERLDRLDFTANPGESHAGRVPAYMGDAALVLKKSPYVDEAVLIRWLQKALDIYGGIFPFFGTNDGGWAEGTFYSTSYTKWYLPFFLAVERFSGFRLLDRPFFQRVSQFFLHFAGKDRENHPFGDGYWCGSEDPEWPGFFAQNPFRVYADRFGPALARTWERKAAAPEIFKLHLLDIFLPRQTPPKVHLTGEASPMGVFEKAGFISCQTNMEDQEHNTALLIRASRYGSISHEHADQGSFALIRNNKTLISPSGYFGRAFGTNHHRLWTRATMAHNCILVDGVGQKDRSREAVGKFVNWGHEGSQRFWVETDLTAAYPMLSWYHRFFTLTENELVVEDRIESEYPCEITWLLHTLSSPLPQEEGRLLLRHKGEEMEIIPAEGLCREAAITDRFAIDLNDGVEKEYWVSMPKQYHMAYHTPKKSKHQIIVKMNLNHRELQETIEGLSCECRK